VIVNECFDHGDVGSVVVSSVADGGVWVVAVVGEHDQSTTQLLAEQTRRVWPAGSRVVVDLSAATFVDSSVILWLLRMRRALAATGHPPLRVVMAAPATAAGRTFELLSPHLRETIGCVATLADAVAEPHRADDGCDGMMLDRRAAPAGDDDAAAVFDRVGARAWKLAAAIVDDARLADEIVVDTFTRFSGDGGRISVGDAALLREVHRRARTEARTVAAPAPDGRTSDRGVRSSSAIEVASVRAAASGLPEPQRTMIELAAFAGLTVTAIASVVGVARSAVLAQLRDGIDAIRIAHICRDAAPVERPGPTQPIRSAEPRHRAFD
jgi:DNA-directed RNA polymerase specialized sigma24 family protein/anti-anti-sigma regulatory factor